MCNRFLAGLGFGLVLALGSGAAARAADAEAPLLHFRGTSTACFPATPPDGKCHDRVFTEADFWLYRDARALLVLASQDAQTTPGSPALVQTTHGKAPAAYFANLNQALAAISIATVSGGCAPFAIDPSSAEPHATQAHFQLTWYGKDFRHNTLSLGSEYPELCPTPLAELYTQLAILVAFLPPE